MRTVELRRGIDRRRGKTRREDQNRRRRWSVLMSAMEKWMWVGCGLVDKTAVGGKMVIREECAVGEVESDDGGRRKRRNRGKFAPCESKRGWPNEGS